MSLSKGLTTNGIPRLPFTLSLSKGPAALTRHSERSRGISNSWPERVERPLPPVRLVRGPVLNVSKDLTTNGALDSRFHGSDDMGRRV